MPKGRPSSKVAALVLNWRDSQRTQTCIRALLQDGAVTKVFLVDNEFDPGVNWRKLFTSDELKHMEILTLEENRGFAGGVNEGLKTFLASDMTHILVINNDAKILSGSVAKLMNAAETLKVPALIGPKLIYPNGSPQSTGSLINWSTAKVSHTCWPEKPDYISWACVLMSKETLEAVGLLDESFFMYWEDADFGLRVGALGGVLEIVEDAVVVHEESATKGKIGQLTVRLATASLGTFARKYPQILRAAKRRVVLRTIRQFMRHGASEARKTIQAMQWGQEVTGIAWKSIKGTPWFK